MYRAFAAAVLFCLAVAARADEPADSVVTEAQAFMEGYARDLAAGDRTAVADRYSRSGAYLLGSGAKVLERYAGIVADYSEHWQAPAAFAWRDLSFEPLGHDRIVVTGGFEWTSRDATAPTAYAYTALLIREDGELRIRLEHENPSGGSPQS